MPEPFVLLYEAFQGTLATEFPRINTYVCMDIIAIVTND